MVATPSREKGNERGYNLVMVRGRKGRWFLGPTVVMIACVMCEREKRRLHLVGLEKT